MISLLLKTSEARERAIRWARGEDVEFPKVKRYTMPTLSYCDMCGNQLKKQYNGYYYCDCE